MHQIKKKEHDFIKKINKNVTMKNTNRLNSSESLANRKNRSSSVTSDSRRIGALYPLNKDGTGLSKISVNTNSSSFCSGYK
jgi:tRNA pseudouridine-54 N-methylase